MTEEETRRSTSWRPRRRRTVHKTLQVYVHLKNQFIFLHRFQIYVPSPDVFVRSLPFITPAPLARHLPIFPCDVAADRNISTSSRRPPDDTSRARCRRGSILANVSRASGGDPASTFSCPAPLMIKVSLLDLGTVKHPRRLTIKTESNKGRISNCVDGKRRVTMEPHKQRNISILLPESNHL